MDSVVGNLFKLLGITGAGLNSTIAPRPGAASNVMLDRAFNEAGEISNPDRWGQFNSIMRRPVNYEEALRLWDEMSSWDLLAAALQAIVDEALQTDTFSPSTLWYECSDQHIEDNLNNMLLDIGVEDVLPSQIWHLAGFGNAFEKLSYAQGEGVTGFVYAHPMDVRRYWLQKNRRPIGFKWFGHDPKKEEDSSIDKSILSRCSLKTNDRTEELWYPWDFLHLRRVYRQRSNEHGEPLFEDAQGIYKKLRMALDQMSIHRAQVQPDRYIMNIDVKDQIPIDQMKTVQRWKSAFRSKMASINPNGELFGKGSDFKSFYDPMALDTVLWMAKPNGFQHSVEKIAGTANVPDVYDIELLTNLFFSVLGMPKDWIGFKGGEGSAGPMSGKALLAQDMKFLRKIKSIRRPVYQGYEWLAYFHILLKYPEKELKDLQVDVKMPPISSLEDSLKLEMLNTQADVLAKLGDVMEKFNLPKALWVEIIFKRYMQLPDDVVDLFITALPAQQEVVPESLGKEGAPGMKKLVEDLIHSKLGPEKNSIVQNLHELMDGKVKSRKRYKYQEAKDVLHPPKLVDNDLVMSGYGQLELTEQISAQTNKVARSLVEVNSSAAKPSNVRSLTEAHIKRTKV